MKPNTCLVVDVWEGQLDINEAVLKANGVAGMSIRINSMSGGHHMDTNFVKQWAEAVNFVRFPYFVYNPWVDGKANFDWLKANMPAGAKSVAIDVEVRKTGYSAATYAGELAKFLVLCKPFWKTIIYTGQWFLSTLSSWPKMDYWWAQYPDSNIYFNGVKTWDELKTRLDKLDKPFNVTSVPGTLKMWQFSGDYLILPGNNHAIDVNIFYGTALDLANYFGSTPVVPTQPKMYYRLLHDAEQAKYNYQPRPINSLEALPETVRINGGTGTTILSTAWVTFIDNINTVNASRFIRKPYNGWLNRGTWPQVEQLSFGGNVVEVTEIVDGRAYIKCLYNDEAPPALTGEFYDPATMHIFGVVGKTGVLDGAPVGNVRTLVIARSRSERLWIPIEALVKVDKLSVYTPPGTTLSGLYTFNSSNYFERLGGGPLTLAMSRIRKLGDNILLVNWKTLKPILTRINPTNPVAVEMIASADWGPSKGIDGDNIKWIGLLWPGRNIVKISQTLPGLVAGSGPWGRVDGLTLAQAATATPIENPTLIQMVYDFHKANGWGERARPVYVPILGGPWWVEMSKLVSVESVLPKTVIIKGFPRLNLREGAGTDKLVIGYKNYGDKVIVDQVTLGKGGIWGRVTGGWIALRHNGTNWTDWKI